MLSLAADKYLEQKKLEQCLHKGQKYKYIKKNLLKLKGMQDLSDYEYLGWHLT